MLEFVYILYSKIFITQIGNLLSHIGVRMSALSFVLISLIFSSCAQCQPLTPQQEEDFRTFIQETMVCRDNAGMSVALVRNGETVFIEGFGIRDMDSQLPMTASTRINIGSLTKAFTATLCAHSVGNGQLNWDAPLTDTLGEGFGMEGQFRSEQVNLRDAMAHKIGLPSYWGISTAGLDASREEIIMERLKHFPTLYDFRSRLLYGEYPFVLAGYAHEVVSGMNWEGSLTEKILQPLGMNNTMMSTTLTTEDWIDTAYSYTVQDGVYTQNPEQDLLPATKTIEPAIGVFSTAEDMAEWIKFNLNMGQLPSGEEIIPRSEMEEVHRPTFAMSREYPRVQRPTFPVDDMVLTKALGWDNGMYRGYEKLHHYGSYSSYSCRISLLPSIKSGVWACNNSPGGNDGSRAVAAVTMYGLDLLLDEEPWLNTTTTCTYPAPWFVESKDDKEQSQSTKANDPKATADNEELAGDYFHPAFGIFSIVYNSTTDSLSYSFGRILIGDINPSGASDMYYMTLGYPLSYSMVYYPNNPDGFPLYIIRDPGSSLITSIQVEYFDYSLPPVFMKQ